MIRTSIMPSATADAAATSARSHARSGRAAASCRRTSRRCRAGRCRGSSSQTQTSWPVAESTIQRQDRRVTVGPKDRAVARTAAMVASLRVRVEQCLPERQPEPAIRLPHGGHPFRISSAVSRDKFARKAIPSRQTATGRLLGRIARSRFHGFPMLMVSDRGGEFRRGHGE